MKKVIVVGHSDQGGMAEAVKSMCKDRSLSPDVITYMYTSFFGHHNIKNLKAILGFKRYVRRGGFDEVFIHFTSKGSAVRASYYAEIAKKEGLRVVLRMHCTDWFYDKYMEESSFARMRTDKLFQYSDQIFVLSRKWAKRFEHLFGYPAVYCPNGIDSTEYDFNEKGKGVLFLGKLVRDKGIFDLVDAAAVLKKQGIDVPVTVAGIGDDEGKIKEYAKKKGVNLEFPGWITGEEKKKALSNAKYLVLPSYHEGFPMVFLEGLASGCILIGTNVGAVPAIANVVIEPGDPEELAATIKYFEDSERSANRIIRRNRERLKEFDIHRINRKLLEYPSGGRNS